MPGNGFVVLVTLANAFEGSICLPLFDSVGNNFFSVEGLDKQMLFSIPLFWNSLFIRTWLSDSLPLSKTEPCPVRRFRDFKVWVRGSVLTLFSVIDEAFLSVGLALDCSKAHRSGEFSNCLSCWLNFSSSS